MKIVALLVENDESTVQVAVYNGGYIVKHGHLNIRDKLYDELLSDSKLKETVKEICDSKPTYLGAFK